MFASSTPHNSSKLRHYIIMTTLVVLGLFVLLLFNSKSGGFGFTSAVVENIRNNSLIANFGDQNTVDSIEAEPIKGSNEIEFELTSAVIPQIQKDTKTENLEIAFNDLTASIKVNDDRLELSEMSQVVLGIKGFTGYLSLDEKQITLDGIAKRLDVNGITLSASKEIKLSFNDLNYQQANLVGTQFKTLEFVSGPGKVKVPSRLDYGLEDGQVVTIYNYHGGLKIVKEEVTLPQNIDSNSTVITPPATTVESSTLITGYANGLDVVSGALNINLR